MKSNDEKIREIAVQLGVTFDVVLSLLQKAFDATFYAGNGEDWCEPSEVRKTVKGGKALFDKVVKLALKQGLLQKRDVLAFVPTEDPSANDLHEYWGLSAQTTMIDDFAGATFDAHRSEEDTYRDAIQGIVAQLWFPQYVEMMVDMYRQKYRAEHHGKEPTARNLHSFMYAPLLSYQKKFTHAQLHKGFDVAVSRGVAAPRYVYKVAEDVKPFEGATPALSEVEKTFVTDDGRECGPLDKWALSHPKYRDAYISLYGKPNE